MRLLTHNLLMCSAPKCDKNNFPLTIYVEKSICRETEFNSEEVKSCVKKLHWLGLYETVRSMGEQNFPKDPKDHLKSQEFLKRLHKYLFDFQVITGKLTCPNCKQEYPIVNGIPNMNLTDSEL